MTTLSHEEYMNLAIEAARPYVGKTAPNPAVGCALVREGEVLATGAHVRAGEDHAEMDALGKIGMRAEGADAYVTLEPCIHGHRDPHCAQGLVSAGVKRVFVGSVDPDPRMRGKGLDWLKAQGIEVHSGILEDECDDLIVAFRRASETGLPLVTLKLATTLDGRLADDSGEPRWITGEGAQQAVHRMRHEHDAVMVGIGTVLVDDARLTTRLKEQVGRQPLRVVLDSQLRTPLTAQVVSDLESAPTLIVTCVSESDPRWKALEEKGVELEKVEGDAQGRVELKAALSAVVKRRCHTVLCEGGAILAGSLLREKWVQRVAWFVSPKLIGAPHTLALSEGIGVSGLTAPIMLSDSCATVFGEDVLIDGMVSYPGEKG